MEHATFTRAIIESLVDRGIREIRQDPKRSIRKLVDLGSQFAKGCFQKEFFRLTQTMLENEESPYYELACRTVERVDRGALKTLGINVGYESWTAGAQKIREIEAREGYNIPWCIIFRLDENEALFSEVLRIVQEGKTQGILCYFFFLGGSRKGLEFLLKLAGAESGCAFLAFMDPTLVDAKTVQTIAARQNLMACPDTGKDGWRETAEHLAENRCLYSLYRRYETPADVQEILSGRWVEEILPQAGTFAFCIAGRDCPAALCQEVQAFVREARSAQRYPLLLSDYYSDLLTVDRIISDSPCFLGIGRDGAITRCAGGPGESVGRISCGLPLTEMLKRWYQKDPAPSDNSLGSNC